MTANSTVSRYVPTGSAREHSEPMCFPLKVAFAPGLFVRGLQFPFPVEIHVEAGTAVARWEGRSWQGTGGTTLSLAGGVIFDLLLLRPNGGAAAVAVFRMIPATDADSGNVGLRHLCAAEVFSNAGRPWNAALLSSRFGLSPAQLCYRLFAERATLREVIWKQRSMRALLTLLTTDEPVDTIASKTGYAGRRHMRAALLETLMIDIDNIERHFFRRRASGSQVSKRQPRARVFRIRH